MKPVRTISAVLATAVMAGGAATPAFAQTADYPTDPTSSQGQRPHGKKHGKHRRLSDAQLTTVATALGTTLENLKATQATVKAAVAATDVRETRAQRDALLAAELNVTVEQLRAAFASVRGTTDGRCGPATSSTTTPGTYPTGA